MRRLDCPTGTAHKVWAAYLRVQPAVVPRPCVCHSGDRSLSSRFWRNVASHHRIEKLHLICMRSISDFPARYHDPGYIASAERWMYGELSFVSMTTLDHATGSRLPTPGLCQIVRDWTLSLATIGTKDKVATPGIIYIAVGSAAPDRNCSCSAVLPAFGSRILRT
jgi:hypothetical protein